MIYTPFLELFDEEDNTSLYSNIPKFIFKD